HTRTQSLLEFLLHGGKPPTLLQSFLLALSEGPYQWREVEQQFFVKSFIESIGSDDEDLRNTLVGFFHNLMTQACPIDMTEEIAVFLVLSAKDVYPPPSVRWG